jgi:hypothetical protein
MDANGLPGLNFSDSLVERSKCKGIFPRLPDLFDRFRHLSLLHLSGVRAVLSEIAIITKSEVWMFRKSEKLAF